MTKRLLLHFLFWCTYIIFEIYYGFEWATNPELETKARLIEATLTTFIVLLPKLILCYSAGYILYNSLRSKKKDILPTFFATLGILIFCVIMHRIIRNYIIFPYLYHLKSPTTIFYLAQLTASAFDLITVFGVFGVIKLFRIQLQLKEREKVLIKAKLESELQFLKAQTNPHFLFNTLNNIYGIALQKDEYLASSVMKLSKIMRFMIYECKKDKIDISEEIKVIEDYISLEKLRYNKRLDIDFSYSLDNPKESIAPLLLLPFVENAFKHGASESRFDIIILVRLKLLNGKLNFIVENSNEKQTTTIVENIGLSNIKRQLEIVYNDYQLKIKPTLEMFNVSLSIDLRKSNN